MQIFRAFVLFLIAWTVSTNAVADVYGPTDFLNKISLRLSAEQWVTSKTALVTIAINAGVNDAALEKIQENVLKKLNELSDKGEWHIISFDRSLDQSGLENIQMRAQARLPSMALPGLREKAKSISKPGETFSLEGIQFTPSEAEIREANIVLRNNIYQQAKEELDRVNKMYPDQKYYMHYIDFNLGYAPMPMPQNTMMRMATTPAQASSDNLAVGDKMLVSATVVFATAPDISLMKMIR